MNTENKSMYNNIKTKSTEVQMHIFTRLKLNFKLFEMKILKDKR